MSGEKVISVENIVTLCKRLVEIPSTRFDPIAIDEVLLVAQEHLQEYPCKLYEKDGTKSLLFYNTSQLPERFKVILNGHLDVVTGTKEQFRPIDVDGKLVGRGTVDMKGGAAAQILVFKALAAQLPYPIGLQLTTDEETGGFQGTGYQVEQGIHADVMITGESTDMEIGNEGKGVLVYQLDTDTHQPAHAAYPWNGDNAILHLHRFITEFLAEFPVPEKEEWRTTVNVASFRTENEEHNKVPQNASLLLDIRHIKEDTADDIRDKILQRIPPNTRLTLKAQGVIPYVDPNSPEIQKLVRSVEQVSGRIPNMIRRNGASDARFYAALGYAGIEFGPTGRGLHTDNEYIDIASLGTYAQILEHYLLTLM